VYGKDEGIPVGPQVANQRYSIDPVIFTSADEPAVYGVGVAPVLDPEHDAETNPPIDIGTKLMSVGAEDSGIRATVYSISADRLPAMKM